MKKINLLLFLINFICILNLNIIFAFGQATKLVDQRRSYSNIYSRAVSNVEDPYDRLTFDNADYVLPRTRELLEFFREELLASSGDLESRIDTLDNVLDKIPGMLCTADEEEVNEKFIKLNLAHDEDKPMSPELLRVLDQKENDLRNDIIDAIDHVLATNGVCDNTPSDEVIIEDR